MSKKIFTADDGRKYQKGSEWIKIHFGMIKNKKHSLYDYKEEDNSITYFTNSGKKYAISQFMRLSYPITIEDIGIICSYDTTCSYKPFLLELSDCCEYVRLWEEVYEN